MLENHFENFPIFIPFLGKNELCLKAKKDYPGELYTHICNLTRCPLKAKTQRVTRDDIVEAVKNLYHSYSSVISKEDILASLNQEKYCPYFFSYYLMQKADIIVTSYPFLENQALFTRLFYSIGIPLDQIFIAIDEAHNLYKPVNQDISLSHIEKAIEEFPHEIFQELLELTNDQQIVESYFDESSLKNLEEELFSLLQSQLMFNNPPSLYAYLVYHFLMTSLEKTLLADSQKVSIINIRPSEILHKLSETKRLVLISGSFEPLRSFQQIFNLPNSRILRVFPPKEEIEGRYFVVWNQRLNAKYENRTPEYYIMVSSTIQNIAESIKGHTLVFAPSYKYIKELEETGILKPDIIESPELDITTLQTIVASSESKKLILCVTGGKIAEGVEFTHNGRSLIKGIIVTSLPYPPPSEESRLIFDDLAVQFGEKLAREFSIIIPMIQRLAQSFGRAIRNKGDRAVHVLLDPRGTKFSSFFNFERHSSIKTLKEKITQFFSQE
ncbi:MAG: hypothetical protein HGN29_14665 [Asgard group archaeon]|nr:hypothetical protein [Asgard group archaeon]